MKDASFVGSLESSLSRETQNFRLHSAQHLWPHSLIDLFWYICLQVINDLLDPIGQNLRVREDTQVLRSFSDLTSKHPLVHAVLCHASCTDVNTSYEVKKNLIMSMGVVTVRHICWGHKGGGGVVTCPCPLSYCCWWRYFILLLTCGFLGQCST